MHVTSAGDWRPVYSNPEYANHPVVGISWTSTGLLHLGAGTPATEAEWEKAARGPAGITYPGGMTSLRVISQFWILQRSYI